MSPASLEALADSPEVARAIKKVRAWLDKRRETETIYPKQIAREVPVEPVALARALRALVSAGVLRQVYKVTTPGGVLSDDEFEDPRDIPATLPDRFHDSFFETAESDVVPVFHKVA
jgi:hypothetical protein